MTNTNNTTEDWRKVVTYFARTVGKETGRANVPCDIIQMIGCFVSVSFFVVNDIKHCLTKVNQYVGNRVKITCGNSLTPIINSKLIVVGPDLTRLVANGTKKAQLSVVLRAPKLFFRSQPILHFECFIVSIHKEDAALLLMQLTSLSRLEYITFRIIINQLNCIDEFVSSAQILRVCVHNDMINGFPDNHLTVSKYRFCGDITKNPKLKEVITATSYHNISPVVDIHDLWTSAKAKYAGYLGVTFKIEEFTTANEQIVHRIHTIGTTNCHISLKSKPTNKYYLCMLGDAQQSRYCVEMDVIASHQISAFNMPNNTYTKGTL